MSSFDLRYHSHSFKKWKMPLSNSREKILTSATECFFQHGYSAANISMIARYVGISRVTIHKQFKSKEALFRAVVEKYIDDKNVLLEQYSQASGDFWRETETFLLGSCGELFEEITSSLVRTDLLHAGQSYCKEIIKENELKVRSTIKLRVAKELAEERITLARVAMSIDEFSQIIESAPFGLAVSSLEEDNIAFVKNLIKVFRASTVL